MLKGRALVIAISAIAAFVALAVAAVGVSFAWYSTHTAEQTGFELNANGIMVVYFDENELSVTGELKPAVALPDGTSGKGATVENVTAFGDLLDDENPLLAETAGIVSGIAYFEYLNSSSEDASQIGKIGATITLGAEAKLVYEDSSERNVSLTRELCVTPTVTVTYLDGVTATAYPSVVFGSSESFHVTGDVRVTIAFSIYLRQVDDLVDPEIHNAIEGGTATLKVFLTSTVVPDEEEE